MPTPVADGIIFTPWAQVGPPTTGTWEFGTMIIDANGTPYVCLLAGTPGTWMPVGLGVIQPPDIVSAFPEFIDTFPNGLLAGAGWTIAALSGTYAQIAPPSGKGGRNGVVGVIGITTGTSATGRVGAILGSNLLRFEAGQTYTLWARFLATELADATNNYRWRLGFIDNNTATEPTDGVYFEYNRSASPNWQAKTASNNTRTIVTTSTVVQNANWIDQKIEVDGSAQLAKFFIDDVQVAQINTNIPTSPGRETSLGFVIHKTAGGTTRGVALDRIYLKLTT